MTQETALNIMKSGHNVFLTGAPGAGKTYVLNQYTNYLARCGISIAITAPTGIAASHIGGMTLHSFFGIGIKDRLSQYDIEALTEKKYLWDRMKELKVLVIDEVSMLSPDLFESIDAILKTFKFSQEPFGGVQIIFTGDFFQLPPVRQTREEMRFIFQTELWSEMNLSICYLDGSYRHEDEILLSILSEIRSGEVSEESMQHFRSRYRKRSMEGITPTKLYTHNIDVDSLNKQELKKLEAPLHVFESHTKGQKKWVEKIFSSSLVLPRLELKEGALVFFVKNNYEAKYINGTLGTIVDFTVFGIPIVETLDGRRIIAERIDWNYTDSDGGVRATVTQVPLRLAWAITVHKSQGMTLDAAEVDLSKAFEPGQGYVALSRIRTLDGLTLMGLNERALLVDEQVLEKDQAMKEYSNELAEVYTSLPLIQVNEYHINFIQRIGGSLDEKAKKETPPKEHFSTLDKTLALVKEQLSLTEIAEARELKESTIINHLLQLKDTLEASDLKHLKPKKTLLTKVWKAVEKLGKVNNKEHLHADGTLKVSVLYKELKETVSYDDIHLALLFKQKNSE